MCEKTKLRASRPLRRGPRGTAALAALLLCLACIGLFTRSPELAELYAREVFARIVFVTAPIADFIPFSLHEALAILLIVFGMRGFVRVCLRIRCPRVVFFSALKRALRRLCITAAWGVALFYLLWGFNYFRPRMIDSSSYSDESVNKEAALALLEECCHALQALEETGGLSYRDEMMQEIDDALTKTMRRLGEPPVRSAKRVKYFLSGILSLGTFTGVTLPLLPEAHISSDLYDHEKPFIIAHEKAHLHGRALESEANYIAILACLSSGREAIRYSGVYILTALLISSLPKEERPLWVSRLSRATQRNMQAPAIRRSFRNKRLAALLRQIYSTYLKAQRIGEGIANYSAALRLVLGYAAGQGKPLRLSADGRIIWGEI